MSTIELPQVKNPSGLQPTDIEKKHPMPDNPPKHMIDRESSSLVTKEEKGQWAMSNSSIEWTDATWNPVVGCAGDRHFNGTVRCIDEALEIPLRWRRPRRVFVNSMSDLFHRDVPFEFIDKVFAVMALRPDVTFQILTKRPERMTEYFRSFSGMYQRARIAFNPYIAWPPDRGRALDIVSGMRAFRAMRDEPLPNVWLGCSIEDQKTADERIPHLLKCPAALRFVSCEPLLGPIWLRPFDDFSDHGHGRRWLGGPAGNAAHSPGIDWVIVGGESGANARPCNIAWIRSIMAQCKAAGVPVFVKQIGAVPRVVTDYEASVFPGPPRMLRVDGGYALCLRDRKGGDPSEWPEDLRVRQWPEVTHAD